MYMKKRFSLVIIFRIVFFIVILDLFPQRVNLLPGLFVRHKLKLRVISRYFDTC